MIERIIDGNDVEGRRRKVANLDVNQLLDVTHAANEFVVSGLCGDPGGFDELLGTLRRVGLADS